MSKSGEPDTRPPALSGALTGNGHALYVRIYYEDTDFSGVVYHASYLRFMERGRSDFLRLLGICHTSLARGNESAQNEPLSFVVRHMDINFLGSARIDDVVRITTQVAAVRGARLVLNQTIERESLPLVKATVTIAMVNNQHTPRRLPQSIRERFRRHAP